MRLKGCKQGTTFLKATSVLHGSGISSGCILSNGWVDSHFRPAGKRLQEILEAQMKEKSLIVGVKGTSRELHKSTLSGTRARTHGPSAGLVSFIDREGELELDSVPECRVSGRFKPLQGTNYTAVEMRVSGQGRD